MAQAKSKRGWAGAAFLTFFAAFWCLVSFGVFAAAWASRSFGAVAFVSLFVVIGIVLAILAIREILALMNPTITVDIVPDAAKPGDEVTVEWKMGRGGYRTPARRG